MEAYRLIGYKYRRDMSHFSNAIAKFGKSALTFRL